MVKYKVYAKQMALNQDGAFRYIVQIYCLRRMQLAILHAIVNNILFGSVILRTALTITALLNQSECTEYPNDVK